MKGKGVYVCATMKREGGGNTMGCVLICTTTWVMSVVRPSSQVCLCVCYYEEGGGGLMVLVPGSCLWCARRQTPRRNISPSSHTHALRNGRPRIDE